jgi:ketosteroid isomerase-like protein
MTGTRAADPIQVALRFNERINARDLDGLSRLMPADHAFVDTEGVAVAGRPACLEAWRGFFAAFPDYRNVFTSLTAHGDLVTVVGYSECSEPSLAGPALWTATVRGEQVAVWQVHTDTPQVRARLAIADGR